MAEARASTLATAFEPSKVDALLLDAAPAPNDRPTDMSKGLFDHAIMVMESGGNP
jgi:hypothetical protein